MHPKDEDFDKNKDSTEKLPAVDTDFTIPHQNAIDNKFENLHAEDQVINLEEASSNLDQKSTISQTETESKNSAVSQNTVDEISSSPLSSKNMSKSLNVLCSFKITSDITFSFFLET